MAEVQKIVVELAEEGIKQLVQFAPILFVSSKDRQMSQFLVTGGKQNRNNVRTELGFVVTFVSPAQQAEGGRKISRKRWRIPTSLSDWLQPLYYHLHKSNKCTLLSNYTYSPSQNDFVYPVST